MNRRMLLHMHINMQPFLSANKTVEMSKKIDELNATVVYVRNCRTTELVSQ